MLVTILGIISVAFTAILMYLFFYHSKTYLEYELQHEKEKLNLKKIEEQKELERRSFRRNRIWAITHKPQSRKRRLSHAINRYNKRHI